MCSRASRQAGLLAVLALARLSAAPAPALSVQGVYCVPLPVLAAPLGAELSWSSSDRVAKLTVGERFVEVRRGTVLATDRSGPVLLPTAPFTREGAFYVPAQAVAERLGADWKQAADGPQLWVDEKCLITLAPAAELKDPPAGPDRLGTDLDDPRIALADRQAGHLTGERQRSMIDRFNQVATPMAPLLTGVAKSKVLAVARHVPLVGELIGNLQDVAGLLDGAVTTSRRLGSYDPMQTPALRDAIARAAAVQADPRPETIRAARPAWRSALDTLDAQDKEMNGFTLKLKAVSFGLGLLQGKLDQLKVKLPKLDVGLSLAPLGEVTRQGVITSEAGAWERRALRDWLQRLIADTDSFEAK